MRVFRGPGPVYILPLFFFLLAAPGLHARDVLVTVEDADLGIPLEGAAVQSWDGQAFECDAEGQVKIPAPEDRQVVIRAGYPGYENGRLVIAPGTNSYTLGLRLGGVMENRELVVEARKPGTSETKSGRSVAISGRELTRNAEIGILEDVMTSVKLLPGVGYSGAFNAMPSIRGGFPGDLTAVFDGFYIERPYHWGGVTSIFDPKMVRSARLSHGVFSSRYGHTISGLLEVSSRPASAEDVEIDIGISTSATSMDLSHPLGKNGGIMLMGKVTYWDPFIWAAKQVIEEVRYVTTAPYIRSGAVNAWYRFGPSLQWTLSGFFGSDGIGVLYENDEGTDANIEAQRVDLRFRWNNRLGFLTTGLQWNPDTDMVLKAVAGTGLLRADLDGNIINDIKVAYPSDFSAKYPGLAGAPGYRLEQDQYIYTSETLINHQGRLDFDWDLGSGFLWALGAQELYSQWIMDASLFVFAEQKWKLFPDIPGSPAIGTVPGYAGLPVDGYVGFPVDYAIDVRNQGFMSSGYTLLEYQSPEKRFGAELGLRLDHLYFVGRDFTIMSRPVLSPRLNLDFGLLENPGAVDSLSLTLGTGLFASMNNNLAYMEQRNGIDDYEMRLNRSWTSIAGTKIDFADGLALTFEAYYKYIFDRAYMFADVDPLTQEAVYKFDGIGRVWGFDLMLQKFTSRWWDGWISYSFNHARYKNPSRSVDEDIADEGGTEGSTAGRGWFFPSFHRFHTLNLVLNLKPVKHFNIATRLSFASGVPQSEVGDIEVYPVLYYPDGVGGAAPPYVISKYKRPASYSDTLRTSFSLPLDVKFSFYGFDKKGKVRSEIYFAIENLLALAYSAKKNSTFNQYTGKENEGSDTASYEMPIPMPSFGFKWSY
ncbi:MAG: hypothetical protein LBT33_10620 [Spirochaetia bacterium]|jgi:hypothetical protein|nr:hypothetical protein [Spirochaetia bacterium]